MAALCGGTGVACGERIEVFALGFAARWEGRMTYHL